MEAGAISSTGMAGVQVTLRVDWDRAEDVPTVPANQFMTAIGLPDADGVPDGVHLIVGHLGPPLFAGTPEEILAQAQDKGSAATVEVQGRFVLTRGRLAELINVLTKAAEQYDSIAGGKGEGQ
ncbi:hypothetical protein AB0I55_03000 [Actinocatenispora sera]|uniref:hypothetical protein n=1 Tax=Actinocatenispora sera TaxID=390989 RepID=UPI0033D4767A